VDAKAAVLMDCQTGLVLWAQNPETELPMASTTKIMSAMVVVDLGADKMDQPVTVSKTAASANGDSAVGQGDTLPLRDMLRTMLICSSNRAAAACAEFLCGNQQQFVARMNDKATEILGPDKHTHFVNPHGLYDKLHGNEHYTTAHDLGLITRYALLHYPFIREIVAEAPIRYPIYLTTLAGHKVRLENHNKLLGRPVPGFPDIFVDGVKTGFVMQAGKCLVASAAGKDMRLITVVLGSDNHYFSDSIDLLSYGFSHFGWHTYATEEHSGVTIPVAQGSTLLPVGAARLLGAPAPLNDNLALAHDRVLFYGERVTAPVARGQQVGELALERDGQVIDRVPAIALRGVRVLWWISVLKAIKWWAIIVLLFFGVCKIYGQIAKISRRRRRKLAKTRGIVDLVGTRDGQR
jgi:D-alanyl-D-alanine carboxypeptidase (penicillin-binding protein 5/6)